MPSMRPQLRLSGSPKLHQSCITIFGSAFCDGSRTLYSTRSNRLGSSSSVASIIAEIQRHGRGEVHSWCLRGLLTRSGGNRHITTR